MSRVLLLCNDVVGEQMAGPGIRYWEFARALAAAGLDVTLAVLPFVPASPPPSEIPFDHLCRCEDDAEVRSLATQADVIVTQGVLLSTYPFLTDLGTPLALDFYIPFLLERLHMDTDTAAAEHLFAHEGYRRALSDSLWQPISSCAQANNNEIIGWGRYRRQGGSTLIPMPTIQLCAGSLTWFPSAAFAGALPSPSGPQRRPAGHRRRRQGVALGRGHLELARCAHADPGHGPRRPAASRRKVVLHGDQAPQRFRAQDVAASEALALSESLGLTGRAIFFNEWVPYAEREDYLMEADLGISLHRDHLETRLSFRTRFLDYMWAGLPVVATRGDVLSEQIVAHKLGRVVEPGDVDGVAEAILSLVDTPNLREAYRPRFEQVAAAYRWDVVTRPLVSFCAAPHLAPDKAYLRKSSSFDLGPTPWWRLPGKAWRALRLGGVRDWPGRWTSTAAGSAPAGAGGTSEPRLYCHPQLERSQLPARLPRFNPGPDLHRLAGDRGG